MEMEKPYIASLTREPFLFYEMRTTAHLMAGGKTESEILEEIYTQNLFQYPTERSILRIARACIRRLHGLEDESLLRAVYEESTAVSKQICLYAIMKDSRLIQEFMVNVIGGKYRVQDLSFSRMELNVFFLHLHFNLIYICKAKAKQKKANESKAKAKEIVEQLTAKYII